MKQFFAGAIVVGAVLYGAAELTLTRPPEDGVIRLRWATDPNPARKLQVEKFGKGQVFLRQEDLRDAAGFLSALAHPVADTPQGRAIARLAERLAAGGTPPSSQPPSSLAPLLAAVNELLEQPGLFRREDIGGLDLPRDGGLLLARPRDELSAVEVVALNRRLLEAAFGDGLAKARRIEVGVESGAREKLIVQCATGTGPDIIDVYGKAHMMTLVEAGVLVDLTAFAADMGFSPANTYPSLKGNLLVDGRQYRYPCNVWANCVVYNPDIFDDHGAPYPAEGWTYEDFIRIGKRIIAGPGRSGRRHLALANYSNMWLYNDLLIGHGGRYFSEDGLLSRLDSPEALAAMRLYHDMMHVHKVVPTPAEAAAMSSQGGWGSGAISWFSNGQAAMISIGRWYLCQAPLYANLRKDPNDPHSDLKLRAVRLPGVGDRPSEGVCDTRAGGVNITSPHRGAAMKFLQYLAGPVYGQVIVRDGDALPPNPMLARTGKDLVNGVACDPAFHQPFIDAMPPARPLDFSPFIDAGQVDRWVLETINKVENRLLPPDEAMRQLAAEINQRIRLNLQRRSDLRRRFEKLAGGASPEQR